MEIKISISNYTYSRLREVFGYVNDIDGLIHQAINRAINPDTQEPEPPTTRITSDARNSDELLCCTCKEHTHCNTACFPIKVCDKYSPEDSEVSQNGTPQKRDSHNMRQSPKVNDSKETGHGG